MELERQLKDVVEETIRDILMKHKKKVLQTIAAVRERTMRRIRWFISFILLFSAVLGCQAIKESGIDTYKGEAVFNRVSFRTDEEKEIYNTNRFSGGIFVPAGTECIIKDISHHRISFIAKGDDYALIRWRIGYGPVNTRASFYKFFVEDKESVGLDKTNPNFHKSILSGRVEEGMTKHEVFLSLGYPAYLGKKDPTTDKSRASILSSDDWYYLKSGKERVLLRFKDRRLSQTSGK